MVQSKLINHSEYSLQEREQLTTSILINEAIPHVRLSTCNRTELYWGENETPEHIVRHLYRVASGLESALTGERAIQGQLKQAYYEALAKYHLSSQLNRLFQSAIHTGKRVRTETKISEGAVSHSQVTVELLKRTYTDLNNKVVGIIGVNKLTEDILKYLASRHAVNIFLSNRNLAKAETLAKQYNGTAMSLHNKRSMLEFTDVLICATSAPHVIIKKEDIPADKEIMIFDLAFPRDVEESAGQMENVTLFNLEQVERFAKGNMSLRTKEIRKAEQIIEEEIAKFHEWQSYVYVR
jgi:glutamyl-tRNA reductase